jgi:hypothetical protein
VRANRLGDANIRTPAFDDDRLLRSALGLRAGPAVSANIRMQNVWPYDEADDAIIHVNGPTPGQIVHPEGQRAGSIMPYRPAGKARHSLQALLHRRARYHPSSTSPIRPG